MAEDKNLATKEPTPSVLNERARELASRLRFMIVGGSKLSDPEIYALAQYAAATGLDPFSAECYYLPGAGPIPGIAGWRRKAQEQLEYEARAAGLDFAEIVTYYEMVSADEAVFDAAKGDIAIKAVVKDTLSSKRWRREVFDAADELRKLGFTNFESVEQAVKLVGPEPQWSAVGVVFASERFAAQGAPEKYDRHERAQKRAEKLALKKRFPRLRLPEPDNADVAAEPLNIGVETPPPAELGAGQPPRAEKEVLNELGFDTQTAMAGVAAKMGQPAQDEARWPEAILDAIAQDFGQQKVHVVNTMKLCGLPKNTPYADVKVWLTLYRAHRNQGLEPSQAAEVTNREMMPTEPGMQP